MNRHSPLSSLAAALTLALGTPGLTQASEQEHLQHNVFAQMPWHELGPVSFGGRITDLAVHPENELGLVHAHQNLGVPVKHRQPVRQRPQTDLQLPLQLEQALPRQ